MKIVGNADVITCGAFGLEMMNVIARSAAGPESDIVVLDGFSSEPCLAPDVSSFNSNWRAANTVEINSTNDQHAAEPLFANAASGDYHQLPGSPTIDAGRSDSLLGLVDLDNQARTQGGAPDIGAFEFPVAVPPVTDPDRTAPTGSKLKFSQKRFLPKSSKRASIAAKKAKKAKGTTATFVLSEAANVKFIVEKKTSGRKKGKSCVAKRKTGKKCTFYKAVKGSFSRASTVGANSFKFTGYVNRKALIAGSYRLVGVPTDAAGNSGNRFTAAFTILKK